MASYLYCSPSLPSTAIINLPIASVSTAANWSFIIKFRIPDLSIVRFLFGRNSQSSPIMRINTNGTMTFSNGTDVINGAAPNIQPNVITWVKLEQAGGVIRLSSSVDGSTYSLNGSVTATTGTSVNVIFKVNNTFTSGHDLYQFHVVGGGYTDSWTEATAPTAGTSWLSTSGTRNITLTNFTGVPADSWWITDAILATIKYWTGSAWVQKPLKYWNGSAWVQKVLKYWDGSTWVSK